MAEESEEACLVNPKSPLNCGQMVYTDGISAAPSIVAAATAAASGSQSSQQSTQSTAKADSVANVGSGTHHNITGHSTANPYDINDDIILSQFHADAIKQVKLDKLYFFWWLYRFNKMLIC